MSMRARREDHLAMMAIVLLLSGICTVATMSCGSGSDGGSNGGLCDRCGDDPDGPCVTSVTVSDEPLPAFCTPGTACTVPLVCVRRGDSAQRRCYPTRRNDTDAIARENVDVAFECDGERPNPRTAVPQPTDTPTATPERTTTSTPGPTSVF
jgi:hypothetical protein